MDIFLDAQVALVPGGERDPGLEIFYLEPVFDVDCDQNWFVFEQLSIEMIQLRLVDYKAGLDLTYFNY